MKFLFAIILAGLTACGGNPDPAPVEVPQNFAQCEGNPKSAIVFVGDSVFPELKELRNTCVYGLPNPTLTTLAATVETAKAAAGVKQVYMVSYGTALPLTYMEVFPGHLHLLSMWNAQPEKVGSLHGSIATVFLNAPPGDPWCEPVAFFIRSQGTPSTCTYRSSLLVFGPDERAAALAQLQLP